MMPGFLVEEGVWKKCIAGLCFTFFIHSLQCQKGDILKDDGTTEQIMGQQEQ